MARHANIKLLSNLRRSDMTREHLRHPIAVSKPGELAKHEGQVARVEYAEMSLRACLCPNGCGELEPWYENAMCCASCGFTWKVVVDPTVKIADGAGFFRRAVRNNRQTYVPKVVPLW